jgi:Na+-driven multidrug efflux pump
LEQAGPLTYGRITKFYVPLALSWLFMAIESPICVGIISRLDDPVLGAAAFQVLMPLAIWIESPVIDLLPTSTTLTRTRSDYVLISQFVLYLLAGVTIAHALVAATPLYKILTEQVFSYPPQAAQFAQLGMIIMIPWSAFIGWRRYLQGILIRNGQTRLIGFGTALRVFTVAVTGLALYAVGTIPSIVVVSIALIASVGSEAAFAHWASRPIIRSKFPLATQPLSADVSPEPATGEFVAISSDPAPVSPANGSTREPLTMKRLVAFHAPLTLTTMVMLIGNPIIGAFLSRADNPRLMLAAWSVTMTLAWLMRTITYALPEVVIALYDGPESAKKLKRYCIAVGLGTTSLMFVLALTGLDYLFFDRIIDAKPEVIEQARLAFIGASLLPFLGAVQSYIRGMLTAHHLTVSRLWAIAVAMTVLVGSLGVLLVTEISPMVAAGVALTLSMSAELFVLIWFWRIGKRTTELVRG